MKKCIALALSFALCLGLTVPAAGAFNGDAQTANAFYDALTALGKEDLIAYAELKDLDGDGVQELIAVPSEGRVVIWQAKNGQVSKTTDVASDDVGTDNLMAHLTVGGKTYIYVRSNSMHQGSYGVHHQFVTVGGFSETVVVSGDMLNGSRNFYRAEGLQYVPISQDEYRQRITQYLSTDLAGIPDEEEDDVPSDVFYSCGGMSWYWGDTHAESYQTVLAELAAAMRNAPSTGGFTDVQAGAYYENAVKWAVDRQITSGTTATTFSPENTCSVVEILTFLWRAYGQPEPTIANPFSDVSASDYYYKAALWAYSKGLVSGTRFNGSVPCTRSMAVTYLWKLAGSPPSQAESYQPLTLSDTLYDGSLCTITFGAASVTNAVVQLCQDDWDWNRDQEIHGGAQNRAVTLITVQEGSRFIIQNPSARDTEISDEGMIVDWYFADDAGVYHSDPLITSVPVLFSGELMSNSTGCLFTMNGVDYFLTEGAAPGPVSDFTDVPATAEYAQAVSWAVQTGVASGTGSGTFSPNTTCTRGQIVTFLYQAMN